MATTLVWVIPGYMGSVLSLESNTGPGGQLVKIKDVWGSIPAIFNFADAPLLTLPSTLPAGQVIVPTALVSSQLGGYTAFSEWLQYNLPKGYLVNEFPWDFRVSIISEGTRLANALIASANSGNANYLVAHSMGALLAWAAWAKLVDLTQTAAIARFLSFGAALAGSNATFLGIEEREDSLDILSLLLAITQRNIRNPFAIPQGLASYGFNQDGYSSQLLTMQLSWPGFYDLWPDFGLNDDAGDTYRPNLYTAGVWISSLVPPNITLANQEVTNFQRYLRQTKYVPPPSICAHVVGWNQQTPWRSSPAAYATVAQLLQSPNQPWTPRARRQLLEPMFSYTSNGDGRVTAFTQAFPGTQQQVTSCAHASQQNDPDVRNLIGSFILGPITPPAPPPVISIPQTQYVQPSPANPPPPPPPQFLIDPLPAGFFARPFPNTAQPPIPAPGTPGGRQIVGIDP